MSFSTFSGPIRAGTVRYGTGRNTGLCVLSQSTTLGLTTATAFVIPAGAQIIDINIDVSTAFTSGATLAVGDGTTADKYVTAITTPGVGRQSITLTAAQVAAWANIGTADVAVTVTMAGTTAVAGAGYITIVYVQRTSDGSANPSTP